MEVKLENLELKINFAYQNKELAFHDLFQTKKQIFKYKLYINGDLYKGNGITGRDSIFLPYSAKKGLKITRQNASIGVNLENLIKIINKIKNSNIEIFPKIYSSEILKLNNSEKILITIMENVSSHNDLTDIVRKYRSIKHFVPIWDIPYLLKNLNVFSSFLDKFYYHMERLYLFPEDEWYKKSNLINNKIVDFARFTTLKKRYKFPANGYSKNDLLEEYIKLVDIFSNKFNSQYIPQWKGMLYEGFKFDNGFTMQGYKSDHYRFDSYKATFLPFNKIKGKDVLDIGSNHGFFSLQASLHGAREVIGVELDKNNIKVANKLKEIMNIKNVSFINQDITKYIFESEKKYELIMMSSVLHQIYKNFKNSDSFLNELSNKCNYFAFETPVNHHTVKLRLSSIHKKLQKYFSVVRIQNVYDAYSSGYRATFICYK